jgi:hypothetical protein
VAPIEPLHRLPGRGLRVLTHCRLPEVGGGAQARSMRRCAGLAALGDNSPMSSAPYRPTDVRFSRDRRPMNVHPELRRLGWYLRSLNNLMIAGGWYVDL